jgi:dTDP-4-dehydrorhamnose 3,5-epimerase
MSEVRSLAISDVKVITPSIFRDARGFLSETYNRRSLAEAGIHADFVQDNHSLSRTRGVLRGLHFQTEPFAQGKLVRVPRGAIFDVAVDSARFCARFLHVGGRYGGSLQGHGLLRTAVRQGHRL